MAVSVEVKNIKEMQLFQAASMLFFRRGGPPGRWFGLRRGWALLALLAAVAAPSCLHAQGENLRAGPVYFDLAAHLGFEYNDNINGSTN